jgi:diadenosine tetraphosphatase ApaH/serine/threonine PP2A family protein phosphatase
MPDSHVKTRAQLQSEHYEWFRSLPLLIKVSDHNVVCVHAGIDGGAVFGHDLHALVLGDESDRIVTVKGVHDYGK